MAIHKEEIEVECPDCDICGRDIGNEEYIVLELEVRKEYERGYTAYSYDGIKVIICKSCIKDPLWKCRLIKEVEDVIDKIKWEKEKK